jgi:hypothetical protein
MDRLKSNIPDGQSDIPALTPLEIEYMRNRAIAAAKVRCKWMIDTKRPAPAPCKCHLVECNNPDSPIYRKTNDDKPFRWKATLCNPNNCKYFTPKNRNIDAH